METTKRTRAEILDALVERDGLRCQYPECDEELDLSILEGPKQATIDHSYPVSKARAAGWSEDEIWDLSNLTLMSRRCNARKGDTLYNEDGSLPERPTSRFRYRRLKRAGRPEYCTECSNGHNLFIGEICANCGCNAQRFPRWAKVRANECSHDITWCWSCSIGITPRAGATEMIFIHGEGGS